MCFNRDLQYLDKILWYTFLNYRIDHRTKQHKNKSVYINNLENIIGACYLKTSIQLLYNKMNHWPVVITTTPYFLNAVKNQYSPKMVHEGCIIKIADLC